MANIANVIVADPVAVELCQSVVGVHILDILEGMTEDRRTRFILSPRCDSSSCTPASECFAETGFNPVDMALIYLPISVLRHTLETNQLCPALSNETLISAAKGFQATLVKPLIDGEADVNGRDTMRGWTALHWASWQCNLAFLNALLMFAKDKVDWNSLTPFGETALQLAEESPWATTRSPEEYEGILTLLRARIRVEDGELHGVHVPGSFPVSWQQDGRCVAFDALSLQTKTLPIDRHCPATQFKRPTNKTARFCDIILTKGCRILHKCFKEPRLTAATWHH